MHDLIEDAAGNLWAGSLGGGIARIAPDGTVTKYSVRNGLPSDSIFSLAVARDGAVWAATREGLVRIERNRIRVFTTADGLSSNRVRSACQTRDGTIWAAGLDAGLNRAVGERFVPFSSPRFSSSQSVTALQCASDNSLWVGTSSGLLHLNGSGPQFYSTRNGFPDNDVSVLAEGREGTIWVGANDGISRIHQGEVNVYRTRDGLSHSQVLSLCLDREGALWAGTKNGLDQFTDGKVTPYTTNEGLLSNEVGPVLEDNGGRLWIGTRDRGLNWFESHRFHSLGVREGLLSNRVLSLALDPTGDLWVGTSAGINRVRNGVIAASYKTGKSMRTGEVRTLFVDGEGTFWAGTTGGLERREGDRFVSVHPTDLAGGNEIIALGGGRTVPLFASSVADPELAVLRHGRLAPYALDTTHPVGCFFLDSRKGTLWMGTLGSGLLRWKDGVISHLYVKDGLYDNRIFSILEDGRGNLWFASSKGIFRLREAELDDFADGKRKAVTSLPFTTGQLRFECQSGVQPGACRTRDGRLWFSTTSGLVVLDPNHLQDNAVPPPVGITALLLNGKRLPPRGQAHVHPGEANNIEIRYAGLSFVSPEKVTFRYRLEGYDPSWIDAGTRREAFYTNLPPGQFTFRVEARNADGIRSTRLASLGFVVEPRLFQRPWFLPVLAVLIGLAAFAGFRFRIRRLRQRFALVLAERSRIARELHDTLLQGLAGITMQLQALWTKLPSSREKTFLGEIIKDAGQCSSEARRSLWGLRASGSTRLELSEKLKDFATQIVAGKPISLALAIEPVFLAEFPDLEYQLLRIAQEAMTNTLKHAGALHLAVSLGVKENVLRMSVEDDGLGFVPGSSGSRGHFGLEGMQERAVEIGADLVVTSSPAGGTQVNLSLRLPRNLQVAGNPDASDLHQWK